MRRGFAALPFDDFDRLRCYAGRLEELAQLLHVLRTQLFGLRLVEHVPVLANREEDPAVRLLAYRAGSLHEMQRVRPGQIVRKWMTKDRLQGAPISMRNFVGGRHRDLPSG